VGAELDSPSRIDFSIANRIIVIITGMFTLDLSSFIGCHFPVVRKTLAMFKRGLFSLGIIDASDGPPVNTCTLEEDALAGFRRGLFSLGLVAVSDGRNCTLDEDAVGVSSDSLLRSGSSKNIKLQPRYMDHKTNIT
jgi:hypothetical protein